MLNELTPLPQPVHDDTLPTGSVEMVNGEPGLILEFLKAPFIGETDGVVEVVGDSMIPTLKPGTRVAISKLADQRLLYWGNIYFVIDANLQGATRRVYEGPDDETIVLRSDNPDRAKYPDIRRRWPQIKAVFTVKADITKH